jgi:hypothetical protein
LTVLYRVLVHIDRLAFELPEFAAEHFLGSSSEAVLIDEGPATLESFEERDIGALRSSHHGGKDGRQDDFVHIVPACDPCDLSMRAQAPNVRPVLAAVVSNTNPLIIFAKK